MGDQIEIQRPEEYQQVARRVANIEKLVEALGNVADKRVDSWSQYLMQKATGEEQARHLEDRQHRRACFVLVYAAGLVLGLAFMALWKGQVDLVKMILSSSLAVAAGAGLSFVLKKKRVRNDVEPLGYRVCAGQMC